MRGASDGPDIRFDGATGLAPAIVQSVVDGAVLMLGYMNPEALTRTLRTRRVTFYSRSRQRLWTKGETSGNELELVELAIDCDRDAILARVRSHGPTCHTGARSCFETRNGKQDRGSTREAKPSGPRELGAILEEVASIIADRDRERPAGSYTAELLEAGVARAAQKVGEEATETALAAVARDREELCAESADLLYHLLVLWRAAGVEAGHVAELLAARRR